VALLRITLSIVSMSTACADVPFPALSITGEFGHDGWKGNRCAKERVRWEGFAEKEGLSME